MKRNLMIFTCSFSMALAPTVAYSQSGVETKRVAVPNTPSVNQGAGATAGSNSTGKAMSFIAGGISITQGGLNIQKGMSTNPVGAGLIALGALQVAMGIMSMAQGNAHGKTANQAGITGSLTDGTGADSGPGNLDPTDPRNPNSPLLKDPTIKAAMNHLKNLEQQGILNQKKGTIKVNGKEMKIKDFATPESMAAAGLPAGAIAGASDYAKEVAKKAAEKMEKLKLGAMTASSGYEEGGGGGSSSSSSSDDGSTSLAATSGSGAGLGLARDPSSLAGMQKNYNGEPIGVAADSIFHMMNRRYKVKESQESFFSDAELALQK